MSMSRASHLPQDKPFGPSNQPNPPRNKKTKEQENTGSVRKPTKCATMNSRSRKPGFLDNKLSGHVPSGGEIASHFQPVLGINDLLNIKFNKGKF
jgi:hypothetical protein